MAEPTFDLNKRWSEAYPELGTEPVPTEPCISPAYFALERERVFRTVWLYVGREEDVARPGDYPVRRVDVCRASMLLVRGQDGVLRGFHNVCSHRGSTPCWNISTPAAWTRCRLTRSGCSSSRCRSPRSPRSSSVTAGEPRVPDSFDESRFRALHTDRSPFA